MPANARSAAIARVALRRPPSGSVRCVGESATVGQRSPRAAPTPLPPTACLIAPAHRARWTRGARCFGIVVGDDDLDLGADSVLGAEVEHLLAECDVETSIPGMAWESTTLQSSRGPDHIDAGGHDLVSSTARGGRKSCPATALCGGGAGRQSGGRRTSSCPDTSSVSEDHGLRARLGGCSPWTIPSRLVLDVDGTCLRWCSQPVPAEEAPAAIRKRDPTLGPCVGGRRRRASHPPSWPFLPLRACLS